MATSAPECRSCEPGSGRRLRGCDPRGAPNVVQVADRWHLLNNLVDTLLRSLERHRGTVREVRDRLEAPSGTQLIRSSDPEHPQTLASQRTQQKRKARLELYQQMTDLIARGKSQSEAAASVGISLRTVQRWITTGVFPERKHRFFPSHVDAFGPYIEKHYAEGCTNASQLWREIRSQGFRGNGSSDGTGCAAASGTCEHPERQHP